ncbi:MAG: TonB-dependent receptor [Bacteroidota bacterium]|nr:TonB-dependent receptor [Bacteroidota bacterium]MDP4215476.1 TonB-dependent receptor [Bacteroidota bacterium]MDP4257797.1 TonB-dependent receptor [Bacteroidota bacterium]
MNKRLLSKSTAGRVLSLTLFLLAFAQGIALAQTNTVTGKVMSSEGNSPLPNVTIRVRGANTSALTGADGSFTIKAAPNATLIFSSVGYSSQEIALAGRTSVTITLASNATNLQQVVVVGYGTVKRKDLTGSIASVSADQIEKVPITTVEQALQGRASGVQVTNNDASPGGNITVLIRGTGSLASNGNTPLYVVDGYPLETGGINNINPNDIASIDILKDASATAIYGVRAGNGVVIITTKKGRKNGLLVSIDAYDGLQSKPKMYKVLNAQQFATLANQIAATPGTNFTTFSAWAKPETLHSVDWQNALYRPGLTQSYSVALRGGNDKVQSSSSVGYYSQKGIVQGSFFKRLTLSSNVDYQPSTWLRSSTNLKYSWQQNITPFGTGGLIQLSQLPPTLDSGNAKTNEIVDGHGNYGFFNPIYTYVAKYANPLFGINNNRYGNATNFFLLNSSLEATIIDGLKVKTNAGVTFNGFSGSYFSPEDDRLVNQYGAQAGATQNAFENQFINQSFDWLWENTLSYDKTFGDHVINFVAGYSAQKNTYNTMAGQGIPPNSVITDLSQASSPLFLPNGQNGQAIQTLQSEFVRLAYNFAGKYYITGTVRRDGSSKFDVGHQYGVFPSGAVSWHIKEEDFLKDVNWLTDLKFRGGYGRVGNMSAIGLFGYDALYASGSAATTSPNYGYTFGNPKTYAPGIYSLQPANPNLRWETDIQTDIGTDAAFLDGHLTLTVDYFNRKSQDFLLTLPAPAQSGYSFLTSNVGSMLNTGLEFALGYNHAVSNDFTWSANLTITTAHNKLLSLATGQKTIAGFGNPNLTVPAMAGWNPLTMTNVGGPVGDFFGYKSVGIFQDTATIGALNRAAQKATGNSTATYQTSLTQPGDRRFADVNKDGVVTASDQTDIGSPIPKFFGGLNLDATYKAFDFNLYFYGMYGNKLLNFARSDMESFANRTFAGIENIGQTYFANAWTPQNHSNTYARITPNDNGIGSNVISSAYVENGSFLKLKNLTVGYTLPATLLSKYMISKLRVYVSTQNLFTVTKYTGLDPEVGVQGGNATQNGIDAGTYPSSRYYTLGVNVTF